MIPPMDELVVGRVYRVHCRNLTLAVYAGEGRFIGIRTKFGSRFLDTEYHWDASKWHGTVREAEDAGFRVPTSIPLILHLGTVDKATRRAVEFDRPVVDGGRGWFFTDTGEASAEIWPLAVPNKELFDFIDAHLTKEEKDE